MRRARRRWLVRAAAVSAVFHLVVLGLCGLLRVVTALTHLEQPVTQTDRVVRLPICDVRRLSDDVGRGDEAGMHYADEAGPRVDGMLGRKINPCELSGRGDTLADSEMGGGGVGFTLAAGSDASGMFGDPKTDLVGRPAPHRTGSGNAISERLRHDALQWLLLQRRTDWCWAADGGDTGPVDPLATAFALWALALDDDQFRSRLTDLRFSAARLAALAAAQTDPLPRIVALQALIAVAQRDRDPPWSAVRTLADHIAWMLDQCAGGAASSDPASFPLPWAGRDLRTRLFAHLALDEIGRCDLPEATDDALFEARIVSSVVLRSALDAAEPDPWTDAARRAEMDHAQRMLQPASVPADDPLLLVVQARTLSPPGVFEADWHDQFRTRLERTQRSRPGLRAVHWTRADGRDVITTACCCLALSYAEPRIRSFIRVVVPEPSVAAPPARGANAVP